MIEMSTVIKIRDETKKALDELKHEGQTYDGIISELIEQFKRDRPRVR